MIALIMAIMKTTMIVDIIMMTIIITILILGTIIILIKSNTIMNDDIGNSKSNNIKRI